jgi:hypothetical protein
MQYYDPCAWVEEIVKEWKKNPNMGCRTSLNLNLLNGTIYRWGPVIWLQQVPGL